MQLLILFIVLSLVGSSIVISAVGASNDSRLLRRKEVDESSRSLINHPSNKFFLCSKGLSKIYCRKDYSTCEIEADTGNSMCRCIDGFGGRNCDEDIDECAQTPYPCAGGTQDGSFCVNYKPPDRFKCGCRQGYTAVLPDDTVVEMIDPVPVEWRPTQCIPTDKCLVPPSPCHVNATCTSSPTTDDGFMCTCKEDFQGDGITTCTLPTIKPKPVFNSKNATNTNKKNDVCTSDADCATTPY